MARKTVKEKLELLDQCTKSGKIVEQSAANFIRQLNSYSEDALNKLALEVGYRSFTYRQMFARWDKYSRIFSGLNITQENKSRVGLITNYNEISITLLYALNQINVPVSIIYVPSLADHKKTLEQFKVEGITDIIVLNDYLHPGYVQDIRWISKRADLRNRIVVKAKIAEKYKNPLLEMLLRKTYHEILDIDGFVRMKKLLRKYKESPINYGVFKDDDAAFVLHTSGTSKGISKPVPLSNKALNSAVLSLTQLEAFQKLKNKAKTTLETPPFFAYGFVNQIHTFLSAGGQLQIVPLTFYSDSFSEGTSFGSNIYFAFDVFNRVTKEIKKGKTVDLSKAKLIITGGFYISKEMKKEIDEFLTKHGAKVKITVGYGLSETAGCCILTDPEDESANFSRPLPGISLKIQDENDGNFYDYNDGAHTGGLFIAGEQVSKGHIGDTTYFELVDVDGKQYLETFDSVSSDGKGNLKFNGRTNRYFVNNDGVRFDESLVETTLSNQKGINACVLAPRYNRAIHDSVPVLYLEHKQSEEKAVEELTSSLKHCFIDEELINKTSLPSYAVFVKKFVYTPSGKVDISLIRSGGLEGETYAIIPINKDGKLVDIEIRKDDSYMNETLSIPEEINKISGKSIRRYYKTFNVAQTLEEFDSFFTKLKKFM